MAANRAYLDGLRLLARRELSEAQVRQRLARKDHDPAEIDEAIDRLRAERALDDARVAAAIARTEALVKRRGKLRARLQIERVGIDKALARTAVDAAFEELDADALIEAALAKRLRGDRAIRDDRELQRLYRYLVAQGHDPERALAALKKRKEH